MDRMQVSLDLPFDPSPARWRELLQRLEEWDRATRPGSLNRLTDPDAPDEEPWTPARGEEALTRLAGGKQFTWHLFGVEDPELISLRALGGYVEISATVKRPQDPVKRVAELLRTLEGGLFPRLAMAWARGTDDDELLMQGLHRLADVPPILFLDAATVNELGAHATLSAAAPSVEIAGGLLLAIADPWKKANAEAKKRRKAVAAALGVTPSKPLSLL